MRLCSILTGQQNSPAALASPSRPGAQNTTSNWTQKGIRVQMVSCLCKFSSSSSVFSQRPMPSPAVSVKGADLNDLVPTSASRCIHTTLSTRKSTLSLSRFPFPRKINYSKREQTSLKCMTSHYRTQSTRWRARSSDWISECEKKHPTLRARAGAAAPRGRLQHGGHQDPAVPAANCTSLSEEQLSEHQLQLLPQKTDSPKRSLRSQRGQNHALGPCLLSKSPERGAQRRSTDLNTRLPSASNRKQQPRPPSDGPATCPQPAFLALPGAPAGDGAAHWSRCQ